MKMKELPIYQLTEMEANPQSRCHRKQVGQSESASTFTQKVVPRTPQSSARCSSNGHQNNDTDWELAWIKAVSFCSGMSNVAWGRYQGNYLNQSGQSVSANGTLRAAGLFAKFLTTPLWGAMADQKSPQLLIMYSVSLTSILFDLYRWPSIMGSFWPLVVLKVARSGLNGTSTLVDITTIRVVEAHERSGGYGSQRLWGTLAWGTGSWLVGTFIDRFGYDAVFVWTYLWSGILLALLLCHPTPQKSSHTGENPNHTADVAASGTAAVVVVVVAGAEALPTGVSSPTHEIRCGDDDKNNDDGSSLEKKTGGFSSDPLAPLLPSRPSSPQLPASSPVTSLNSKKQTPSSALQQLRALRRLLFSETHPPSQTKLGPFLVVVMCYSISMVLVETFMMVQLDRDYHSSKQFIGTLTLVGMVTQIPTFHYSSSLIGQFGHRRLFQVAHAILFLRLLAMAALVNERNYNPTLLVLQLSHGGCFALTWAVAVDFSSRAAPPGLAATCQAATSTAYFVVGSGVGSVLWSYAYDAFGGRAGPAYTLGALVVLFSGTFLVPSLPCPRWNGTAASSRSPKRPMSIAV